MIVNLGDNMPKRHLKSFEPFWYKCWRQLLIISLMVILLFITIPLSIVILVPALAALRLIVKLLAAKFRPDLCQILDGKGTVFAVDSIYKRPDFNILVYLFCNNGPMPVEQFRLQFEERVLHYTDDSGAYPYENLTQTWTSFMGFLFWKWDKDFKLDNHIRLYDYTDRELALPAKCNEDDLKRVMGELVARPWVEGRSPWEILIVPDYRTSQEPEKVGSVAILRIHHAMIDGYSILTMLLRFSGSLGVKRVLPTFPKLSSSQKLTRPLLLLLKLPYDLAEFVVDSFDGPNCWHFLWKPLSRKYHVFFSDEIDVDKVKKIRSKYGVGYNAAVYSITAGSIRRLMLASGHEPPKSLSVFVPFPLPNHPGGLVLHASCSSFKFSPRLASAKERIGQIAANLKSLQELPTGPTTCAWFNDITARFPIWLLKFSHYNTTAIMTSMPGPEVEVPMVGEAIWTGMSFVLSQTSKVGAVAGMVTMAGKQRITLTVDKAIYEGYNVPTKFPEFVHQEMEDLLNERKSETSTTTSWV